MNYITLLDFIRLIDKHVKVKLINTKGDVDTQVFEGEVKDIPIVYIEERVYHVAVVDNGLYIFCD